MILQVKWRIITYNYNPNATRPPRRNYGLFGSQVSFHPTHLTAFNRAPTKPTVATAASEPSFRSHGTAGLLLPWDSRRGGGKLGGGRNPRGVCGGSWWNMVSWVITTNLTLKPCYMFGWKKFPKSVDNHPIYEQSLRSLPWTTKKRQETEIFFMSTCFFLWNKWLSGPLYHVWST